MYIFSKFNAYSTHAHMHTHTHTHTESYYPEVTLWGWQEVRIQSLTNWLTDLLFPEPLGAGGQDPGGGGVEPGERAAPAGCHGEAGPGRAATGAAEGAEAAAACQPEADTGGGGGDVDGRGRCVWGVRSLVVHAAWDSPAVSGTAAFSKGCGACIHSGS